MALAPMLSLGWGLVASLAFGAPEFRGGDIIGGDEVPPGGWPTVVAIVIGDLDAPTQQLCTGTVVHERLVLTAAHCLHGVSDPADVLVLFGNSLEEAAQSETSYTWAESFGVHPDYCEDLTLDCWDIGYVVLDKAVGVGAPILPLATQEEVDDALGLGAPLTVVGFGQDDDEVSGTKREVDTKVSDHSPAGYEFMAGGNGMDSCLGDSGGPAFAQLEDGSWRLAGIVSRGSQVCGDGGIYGNPLPAMCWVRDESGIDLVPESCASCDCVDLPNERAEDDEGCRVVDPHGAPVWWLAAFAGVVVTRRRRRRSRGFFRRGREGR